MGRKTEEARRTLHTFPEQRKMQAVLHYETAGGDRIAGIAEYGSDFDHVEMSLMKILNEKTKNFADIKDSSTLIFAAKWSPCVKCTTETIPDFLRVIGLKGRSMRVKFRFEAYYTRANWGGDVREGGGKNFWTTDTAAQQAYDKLCAAYGIYDVQPTGAGEAFDPQAGRMGTYLVETSKAKLVMQPCTVHKTSTTATFFV